MRKRTVLSFLCLLFSLLLFACTATSQESSVPSTENGTADAGQTEQTSDTYYRMTYTKPPVDISEIMHALLTDDAEQAAFDAAQTNESTLSDGRLLQEGAMTLDKTVYRWSECAGIFTFFKQCEPKPTEIPEAEQLTRDFLERLGWEYGDELRSRSLEDGTVDVRCRLYYHGVKLMGLHTLYFEPGNEDEIGLSGSYIQVSFSGSELYSAVILSIPTDGEILQTYDAHRDFLNLDEAKDMVMQYIEKRESQIPRPDQTLYLEKMSIEMIYMPYRYTANGNEDILMPAFEVRIPFKRENMPEGTLVLYLDPQTGYVYDANYEFF